MADSNLSHFLANQDIMLPCPPFPPFFGLVACVAGAKLVALGFEGGGGSSSEKDSQAGSVTVTLMVS